LQFYLWLALDRPGFESIVLEAARGALGADAHPGAVLRISEPFAPAELLRAGPPEPWLRAVGVTSRDRRGRVLTDDGLDRNAAAILDADRRGAEFWAGDIAAGPASKALGALVAVAHSDEPPLAYMARFRGGRCEASTTLIASERLSRYDGHRTHTERRPGVFPERDRAGVLLAGLEHLAGARIPLEEEERLTLAEILGWLPEEGEEHPLDVGARRLEA
jgi:hypothetical protein